MLGRIGIGLEGPDPTGLALLLHEHWFPGETPHTIKVDAHPVTPTPDWIRRYPRSGNLVSAHFAGEPARILTVHAGRSVWVAADFHGDPDQLVEVISQYPFEIASFVTRFVDWEKQAGYYAPRFAKHHYRHGWACAFRGAGHHALVSRRWLETGPWQVRYGPNDTTLVQFHDLHVDGPTALAQAQPGHLHMGPSDEGGFMPTPYEYSDDIKGMYDADRRVLKKPVMGRPVPHAELRDACAIRRDQILGPDQPVDNVAFVFLDPREVEENLPRLEPYQLECWTIVDGVETRLDRNQPPPPPTRPRSTATSPASTTATDDADAAYVHQLVATARRYLDSVNEANGALDGTDASVWYVQRQLETLTPDRSKEMLAYAVYLAEVVRHTCPDLKVVVDADRKALREVMVLPNAGRDGGKTYWAVLSSVVKCVEDPTTDNIAAKYAYALRMFGEEERFRTLLLQVQADNNARAGG